MTRLQLGLLYLSLSIAGRAQGHDTHGWVHVSSLVLSFYWFLGSAYYIVTSRRGTK